MAVKMRAQRSRPGFGLPRCSSITAIVLALHGGSAQAHAAQNCYL